MCIASAALRGQVCPANAVSLVAQDEAPLLSDIERLLKRNLAVAPMPEFEIPAASAVCTASAVGRRRASPRRQRVRGASWRLTPRRPASQRLPVSGSRDLSGRHPAEWYHCAEHEPCCDLPREERGRHYRRDSFPRNALLRPYLRARQWQHGRTWEMVQGARPSATAGSCIRTDGFCLTAMRCERRSITAFTVSVR